MEEIRTDNINENVDLPRMSVELTQLPSSSNARVSFDEQPRVSIEESRPSMDVRITIPNTSSEQPRPSVDNPFQQDETQLQSLNNLRKSNFLRKKNIATAVSTCAMIAASLLIGDGVITPAISVVSISYLFLALIIQ